MSVYAATLTEWALLLGAIGVLVTAIAGAAATVIIAVGNARKLDTVSRDVADVHHELRTLNGSTVGQLADASETRRVELIPPADRTPGEAEHVAVVPPSGKAQDQ